MKLLGIETSGKMCGVCILEDNKLIDKLELNNRINSFRIFNAISSKTIFTKQFKSLRYGRFCM